MSQRFDCGSHIDGSVALSMREITGYFTQERLSMLRTRLPHCPLRLLFVSVVSMLFVAAPAVAQPGKKTAGKDESFTVVLIPDTQLYSLNFPKSYLRQTQWIKDNAKSRNIKFAIHLGDIVHRNTAKEWAVADRAMSILDGVVPYSMTPGNHDMGPDGSAKTRDTNLYNKTFPPSRYKGKPWYGGNLGKTNDNNFCLFEGGGIKFLVISLEFAPTDLALDWANRIVAQHKDRQVIVATHSYQNTDGSRKSGPLGYGVAGNNADQMWNRFVRKHDNIFMVVCGHVLGVAYKKSQNGRGGYVHEILTDYQGLKNGGNGWLRWLKFVPSQNKIYIEAYSPVLDKFNLDPKHTLSIDYKMTGTRKAKGN